jgi:hypothetical protein
MQFSFASPVREFVLVTAGRFLPRQQPLPASGTIREGLANMHYLFDHVRSASASLTASDAKGRKQRSIARARDKQDKRSELAEWKQQIPR